jgi:hypothetical protein
VGRVATSPQQWVNDAGAEPVSVPGPLAPFNLRTYIRDALSELRKERWRRIRRVESSLERELK